VQKLHLVGFTTDRRGLIFSARRGAKSGGFVVLVDDDVRAAVEEALATDAPTAAEAEAELNQRRPESALSVREVQARLRSGRTIDEVAALAGMEPAWVARFAAPIVAEQAQMVAAVRASVFEKARIGPSALPIGEAVYRNLAEKGVVGTADDLDSGWSARQLADGLWLVSFEYVSRGRPAHAGWDYDEREGTVRARDRLASMLAYRAPAPGAVRAPAARGRSTVSTARKAAATRMAAVAQKSAARNATASRRAADAKAAAAKRAEAERAHEAAEKAAARQRLEAERAREAGEKAAARQRLDAAREKERAARERARAAAQKAAAAAERQTAPQAPAKKAAPVRAAAPVEATTPAKKPAVKAAVAPLVKIRRKPASAPRRPRAADQGTEPSAGWDAELLDSLAEPKPEPVRARFRADLAAPAAEHSDNGASPPARPARQARPKAVAVPAEPERPPRRAPLRGR
jgi:hypothetical protein